MYNIEFCPLTGFLIGHDVVDHAVFELPVFHFGVHREFEFHKLLNLSSILCMHKICAHKDGQQNKCKCCKPESVDTKHIVKIYCT